MPNTSKYDKTLMAIAYVWSKESYCKRRQVGAIIAKNGREIAPGYNGTVHGKPNICEKSLYVCDKCGSSNENINDLITYKIEQQPINFSPYPSLKSQCKNCGHISYSHNFNPLKYIPEAKHILPDINILKTEVTSDFVVHAEQNAILFCAKLGIPTEGTTMYTTTAPCKNCAKFIAQAGIVRLVFDTPYKNTEGIDFLKSCNIQVDGPLN